MNSWDFLSTIDMGGGPTSAPQVTAPQFVGGGATWTDKWGRTMTANPQTLNPEWLSQRAAQRSYQQGGGGGGAWGINPSDLMAALQMDTANYQQAADEQWARNNAQIAAMQDAIQLGVGDVFSGNNYNQQLLGGLAGDALNIGDAQFDNIESAARDARDRTYGQTDDIRRGVSDIQGIQGDMIGDVLGGADRSYADVTSDVNESYALMDAAGDEFKQYLDEFEDRAAKDASAIASGIYSSGRAQMQMIKGGMRPDGLPMSGAEQAQAMAQVQYDVGQQVQQNVTGLFSDYNNARLQGAGVLGQMRQAAGMARQSGAQIKNQAQSNRLQAQSLGRQLAADMMAGEQIKLGAAQLDAQAGQAYADDVQAAEQARTRMFELATGLGSQMAQLNQAAMFKTADLRIQGRQMVAEMVANNPRSVVGIFESLLSMYTAGRASQQSNTAGAFTLPTSSGGDKDNQKSIQHFGSNPYSMFGRFQSMGGGGSSYTGPQMSSVTPTASPVAPPSGYNEWAEFTNSQSNPYLPVEL